MAEADKPKMTMKYAVCLLGNLRLETHTHSEYIILVACPRQQALRERARVALYVHCLVVYIVTIWLQRLMLSSRFFLTVSRFHWRLSTTFNVYDTTLMHRVL
jgi:hypothetical protein